jgi:hypothetical protein
MMMLVTMKQNVAVFHPPVSIARTPTATAIPKYVIAVTPFVVSWKRPPSIACGSVWSKEIGK